MAVQQEAAAATQQIMETRRRLLLLSLLLLLLLLLPRIRTTADPEGARQEVERFSTAQDVPSKNPGATSAATEDFDVTRKAVSFGYFSLGPQRKVTRRKAKAVAVAFNDNSQGNSNVLGSPPSRG